MIINFANLGGGGGGSDPRLASSAFTGVEYISSAKTIEFSNLAGNVIGSIDASDFVIDGMVEDVYISGNTLVIEFNTESGKQDINVDLSDIFDPDNYWTSAQTQNAITEATEDFVTSGDVATQISAATVHMVESEDNSIVNIIRISQADYDVLVSKDPYTLYVIVNYIGEWEDVLGDHKQYKFTILDNTSSLWNNVKIGTIHCWYLPEGQGSASVVEGDVDIYINYTQSSWYLRFTDNSTFDDTFELYDGTSLYESNISVVEVSGPSDTNWKPLGFEINNEVINFSGFGSPISLVTINPILPSE